VNGSDTRPRGWHRLAAASSLLLIAAVIVGTVVQVGSHPLRSLGELILFLLLLAAVWVALTETGGKRFVAVIVAAAACLGLVLTVIGAEGLLIVSLIVRIAVLVVAFRLASYALGTTETALRRGTTPGEPVPAATRGVLFMNLKSGGGKAERFHLVDECRRRGIEPVVLERGQDWLAVIEDKAAGADVVGMAGGDGSQALLGTIAAERGIPMVVVPAGTRNHLALDLGLDREDVVGALDAFGEAVERTMDLADVNGKVFVNNVSLGIYAAIVRSPEYRDAKVDTTLATLPQVLGRGTEPFDLRFTGPDGEEHKGAHLIQVSNNPYGTTGRGRSGRPRLDTHRLGVISLVLDRPGAPAAFLAALAKNHPERFAGYEEWAPETFEVTSDESIELGLDGEAMALDPPIRFSIRPRPVRVRLPHHAFGYSPAARASGSKAAVENLWAIALGRPARFGS
jgi:diacylglycerol kinase family enzyme